MTGSKTKTSLAAAAVVAGCVAGDPATLTQLDSVSRAGWVRVSATELRVLMSDATQKYDSFVGPGIAYFAANGSARLNHSDDRVVAEGRWWVEGDSLCVVWGDAKSHSCRAVVTRDGVYRSFDELGRFSSEFIIEDGSTEAF